VQDRRIVAALVAAWLMLMAAPAEVRAEDPGPEGPEPGAVALTAAGPAATVPAGRGPVTGLPLPRFVSLKTGEGRVRRGPGLTHAVDWIFLHRDMPLRVTAEHEHWRRVEDREGVGGWVHYSLLSGVRTVLVEGEGALLRAQPDPRAPVVARAEGGAILRLLSCRDDWCRVGGGGHRGWIERAALWGVAPGETVD
jgi:SH3-like domain-containing protein